MGLYDRDYVQENYEHRYDNAPRTGFGLPGLTNAVKFLLAVNFTIFFAGLILSSANETWASKISVMEKLFAVFPYSIVSSLQVWRLFTYQFLHADGWHIFYNMLGLFFLGPALERYWGTKKFIIFYLLCGAAGGLFYTFLVFVGFLEPLPMVGASGSILGLLAACAILFPHFVVFVILFPVPIRVAAIGLTLVFFAIVLSKGPNAGGEAAHLAGMAAGAGYVLSRPLQTRISLKIRSARWRKKILEQQALQTEIDRILQKVHDSGIHSLSSKEKKTLKKATEIEQMKSTL